MTTRRPTVVIADRAHDAAVLRSLLAAVPAGLPPDHVADGLTAESTAEALAALERDGLLRRDEVDAAHPTSRLQAAMRVAPPAEAG